jgi:ribose 5-phosphate isomerase B
MVVLGSDHGGLELKEAVKAALTSRGVEIDDYGTVNGDSVDYPDFAEKVASAISRGDAELGILVC